MPVTRDPDFPAEIAALMMAFNRCADGYSTIAVLEASANMLIAAIGGHTRTTGCDVDIAVQLAQQLGAQLPQHVREQWERERQATDVDVPMGGN